MKDEFVLRPLHRKDLFPQHRGPRRFHGQQNFLVEVEGELGRERLGRAVADDRGNLRRVVRGGRQPFAGLHNPLTVEHLGEFHWRFLVGDHDALGWVDDRVTIAQDDHCQPTVLVETKWQDEKHARNFRDAYVAFLRKRGLEPLVAAGGGTTVKVAYGVDDALMERFTQ